MIPVKSNTAEQGCSPVSSNCVIWQGPSLPCINLCNGDTISDVVYKIATNLCSIQSAYDLSELDLSCLVAFCTSSNPAPTTKTLPAVLDFIVKKVCCLNDRIETLEEEGGGGGGDYQLPVEQLPACLQYVDPGTGQTVTQLVLNQYVLRLANQFCSLKATVDTHTTQITNLNTRVTILEARPLPTPLPTVTPNCILTPGVATPMATVLDELEAQYCLLRSTLGSNGALTTAVAQQCPNLGSSLALSAPGTISSLPGWNNTVVNVAQSLQNMWVVLCDMRSAIYDIKECCGQTDCSEFIIDFSATANEDRSEVTVFFNGQTVVPAGFDNCTPLGSKITITDQSGHSYIDYVDLVAAQSDTNGITYTVSGAGLVNSQVYTITVEGCVSKDGNTCQKETTVYVSVPCPLITNVTATLV